MTPNKPTMTDYTIDFILACKAKNSIKALKEAHKEHHLVIDKETTETCILYTLAEICDDYNLISTTDLLKALRTSTCKEQTDKQTYALLYAIRFTQESDFGTDNWEALTRRYDDK